jgi:hypothetical protein
VAHFASTGGPRQQQTAPWLPLTRPPPRMDRFVKAMILEVGIALALRSRKRPSSCCRLPIPSCSGCLSCTQRRQPKSARRHISLGEVHSPLHRRHRDLTEEMSFLLGRFGKPQDSKFQCLDHCLGPVGDPQLRDDVLDVILGRAKAYYKIRSNLAVGASQLHES